MINARDAEGSTPLLWAVRIEDEVITQYVLRVANSAGALVELSFSMICSLWPTMLTFFFFRLLLDMGADTNLPNKDSQTALHLAVMCSAESNLVQALLQAQANPNVLDNEVGSEENLYSNFPAVPTLALLTDAALPCYALRAFFSFV